MLNTYSALRTQHERNRSPSERVKDNKQVDADNRKRRVSVERLAWNDGVDCLVDANVEHGESLSGATNDKRPFASKLFGSDHETDSRNDYLNDAVDSGGK